MSGVTGALRRWRDEAGNTRALVAARVVLGGLLFLSAVRAGLELRTAYFGDVFHWPLIPEALVPSRDVYAGLVALEALLAAMVVAGLRPRLALFASAVLNVYVLLCDRLEFHHNRWALACDALLLALAPCDCTREAPLWAARLAQLQVVIVYASSGGSKLFDPDWRSGLVLGTRFALYAQNSIAAGVPPWLVAKSSEPRVAGVLAAAAIATELALTVFLWPRRTRAFALWWGVMFHLTIEATSRVESFTWLTLAMYALFARPEVHGRRFLYDPSRPAQRAAARALGWLDWLQRFEVQPGPEAVIFAIDRGCIAGRGARRGGPGREVRAGAVPGLGAAGGRGGDCPAASSRRHR